MKLYHLGFSNESVTPTHVVFIGDTGMIDYIQLASNIYRSMYASGIVKHINEKLLLFYTKGLIELGVIQFTVADKGEEVFITREQSTEIIKECVKINCTEYKFILSTKDDNNIHMVNVFRNLEENKCLFPGDIVSSADDIKIVEERGVSATAANLVFS